MNAGRTRVEALYPVVPAVGARSRRLATTVMLAVAVWVSALPFALFLVVPRVGIGLAIPIAIGLLAGIFLLCWLGPPAGPDSPRFTVVVSPDRPEVREELARVLSGENVRVILGPEAKGTGPATRTHLSDECCAARWGNRPAPESPRGGRGSRSPQGRGPTQARTVPRFTVVVSPDRPEVREELARELPRENVSVILGPASGRTAPGTRIQVSDRRWAGRPLPGALTTS